MLAGELFVPAAHRVASIQRIPPYLIEPHQRAELIHRAWHGADVRAWSQWTPPGCDGVWYLWDGEERDPQTDQLGRKIELGRERI